MFGHLRLQVSLVVSARGQGMCRKFQNPSSFGVSFYSAPDAHSKAPMTNNDSLRRLRYALDLTDAQMVAVFGLGGQTVTETQVRTFMISEEDEAAVICTDPIFGGFLDGLIIDRRGPPPAGRAAPPVFHKLTNNTKLKKLRIALNLHEDAMLSILMSGGHPLSRGELTALFRKPQHKHYRECGDQVLRKFLSGLTKHLRSEDTATSPE
jgi:uncharacterized protein YehS (DUF1456 family)